MTNKTHSVLYTGVTSDIETRVEQHRNGVGSVFTRKYRCHKLVYLEEYDDVTHAINREKQIKAGSRADKVALIRKTNPEWKDLSEAWRPSSGEVAASGRPREAPYDGEDYGGRPSSQ
jgi:putative endonuclease